MDKTGSVYEEFDYECRQKNLSEIFNTKSQTTYIFMRNLFESHHIAFSGYGDDYNGDYEIRFSPYLKA